MWCMLRSIGAVIAKENEKKRWSDPGRIKINKEAFFSAAGNGGGRVI